MNARSLCFISIESFSFDQRMQLFDIDFLPRTSFTEIAHHYLVKHLVIDTTEILYSSIEMNDEWAGDTTPALHLPYACHYLFRFQDAGDPCKDLMRKRSITVVR